MKSSLSKKIADTYLKLFKSKGEQGFYKYIIAAGISRRVLVDNPEVEILDLSDDFLTLFRRTGEHDYFIMSKILRKAAHKLYRQFLQINKNKPTNYRFLQAIK